MQAACAGERDFWMLWVWGLYGEMRGRVGRCGKLRVSVLSALG